jgi:hypothetical protein
MASPRVLVLSYCHKANFGDRLGFHMINAVLPPDAEVVFHPVTPWKRPDESNFDLMVLGIGNSLNPSVIEVLYDPLMRTMDACGRVIGIFGTQYRECYDMARLARFVGRLDHWYARYRDDLAFCGAGARASHFGDWLIDAVPLSRPTRDRMLQLQNDLLSNRRPLDWLIQEIQSYRYVASPRLHTLLCAMCSAEQVSYEEQHEVPEQPELVSGKFAAMFKDVFGRTFPENDLFPVDRDAIVAYRRFARANVERLKADIAAMF